MVEGFAGVFLIGWVEAAAPAEVTVLNEAGRVLATGPADQRLPHPAASGPAASGPAASGPAITRFGFRVRLDLPDGPGEWRVLVAGRDLAGSPVPVGPRIWDGALVCRGDQAEGWLHPRSKASAPPLVSLFDQFGSLLAEQRAVETETAPDAPFRPFRFHLTLPQAALTHGLLHLRATADGLVFATACATPGLVGAIEQLTADRCRGWIHAEGAPGRRLRIEIWRDGRLMAEGLAADPREIPPAGDTPARTVPAGFDFRLAAPPGPGPWRMALRLAGTDAFLLGSPFLVGQQRDLIAPLHRAAATARRAGLDPAAAAALAQAVGQQAACVRQDARAPVRIALAKPRPGGWRLCILIPIHRDLALTRACIESVLAARDPRRDAVVLINDASPEAGMAALLRAQEAAPNLFVLTNPENLGFIGSINRGLAFSSRGDVVLLNADTRVFAGCFDELHAVAHAGPGIGTVTALSNAATIFSYPIPNQGTHQLADMDAPELAAVALRRNRGLAIEVPTGHGFCMLITRTALDEVGNFDPAFGRGYGEENDFCRRASDRGLRHVAAAGVFVEHRESVSFSGEKAALLARNLALLGSRYPEYAAEIEEAIRRDPLRLARFALDDTRLAKAVASGSRTVVVVRNWLGGGTPQAIVDIEARIGHDGADRLDLAAQPDGSMQLRGFTPRFLAVFAADETDALMAILETARPERIILHQALGYPVGFVQALCAAATRHRLEIYLHDFYTICPRVTMIDGNGRFCGGADAEICRRCVTLDEGHEAHRMEALDPAQHRALFRRLLGAAQRVIAPSASTAAFIRRIFPRQAVEIVPHPEPRDGFNRPVRGGNPNTILLLGALGPHKGSHLLLAIARHARIAAPALRFAVIGYTADDPALLSLGNVTISGFYRPHALPALVDAADGTMALFLHIWPETYSYTLSEAVRLGLVPIVPDLGAPAERVRAAGFGQIVPSPIDPVDLVGRLDRWARGEVALVAEGRGPWNFAPAP